MVQVWTALMTIVYIVPLLLEELEVMHDRHAPDSVFHHDAWQLFLWAMIAIPTFVSMELVDTQLAGRFGFLPPPGKPRRRRKIWRSGPSGTTAPSGTPPGGDTPMD